ncbi:MAG: helix-turn-helix domain-containing protein [bacterium]
MNNHVKECRLKAHLSQEELAQKSERARPTISKIERNECEPSDLSKQKIADALGFPIEEVFPGAIPSTATSFADKIRESILGICIVNGNKLVPGMRSDVGTKEMVEVKDTKIEGFLIDQLGKRKPFVAVHLIKNGEKVDATVTSRDGRFVFNDVVPGEYVVFSEDKLTPVQVGVGDDTFEFKL